MDKDIKFPERHARRENCIWFPVVVDGIYIDCTVNDKFIDQYIRGDSLESDEDIFINNRGIINILVEYKIKNDLYNRDGSISINENDGRLFEIINT